LHRILADYLRTVLLKTASALDAAASARCAAASARLAAASALDAAASTFAAFEAQAWQAEVSIVFSLQPVATVSVNSPTTPSSPNVLNVVLI
jgi:hypothetical protein